MNPTVPAPTVDWARIGRYLAGELPAGEAAEVRRWLESHPAESEAIAALDSATKGGPATRPVDVEEALRRVKARRSARPVSWRATVAVSAAAAVILLALGWLGLSRGRSSLSAARTFATAVGQTDTVMLAGTSRVILGPASTAVVRNREIQLTGHAFFSIRDGGRRGYVVRAGGATIRDIGTDFGVDATGADVRVVVLSGAVEMTFNANRVILDSADVGVAHADGSVTMQADAARPDDLAWTRGRLVLRDASLVEIAAELRRWHGLTLVAADTGLAGRHFTGAFADETPDRVVEVIALALGAAVERRADTVIFRARATVK